MQSIYAFSGNKEAAPRTACFIAFDVTYAPIGKLGNFDNSVALHHPNMDIVLAALKECVGAP